MSQYSHKTWICPYYKWDEKQALHCQHGTKLCFPDTISANSFMGAYCASFNYKNCPIYVVFEAYEERLEELKNEIKAKKENKGGK